VHDRSQIERTETMALPHRVRGSVAASSVVAPCRSGPPDRLREALRTPIEGCSFQHCAEKFLGEAMQAIPVVRRRSTLQVHPSALPASVFLTIVLHAQATSERSPFRATAMTCWPNWKLPASMAAGSS
jgi:hypothetical protein